MCCPLQIVRLSSASITSCSFSFALFCLKCAQEPWERTPCVAGHSCGGVAWLGHFCGAENCKWGLSHMMSAICWWIFLSFLPSHYHLPSYLLCQFLLIPEFQRKQDLAGAPALLSGRSSCRSRTKEKYKILFLTEAQMLLLIQELWSFLPGAPVFFPKLR